MDGRIDISTLLFIALLIACSLWLYLKRRSRSKPRRAESPGALVGHDVVGSDVLSVFVSYARADAAVAQGLATYLSARGYEVWWDIDLVGSDEFREVIQAKLRAATAIIVIWSPQSVASRFVRQEADEGLHFRKLVSTRVRGLEVMEIPLGFREQHTDFVDDRAKIVVALERIMRSKTVGATDATVRTRGHTQQITTFALYRLIKPKSILGFPFIAVDGTGKVCVQLSDDSFSLGELTEEENSYVLTDYTKIKQTLAVELTGLYDFTLSFFRAKLVGFTAHFYRDRTLEHLTLTLGEDRIFEMRYSFKDGQVARYDHKLSVEELAEVKPFFDKVHEIWNATAWLRTDNGGPWDKRP